MLQLENGHPIHGMLALHEYVWGASLHHLITINPATPVDASTIVQQLLASFSNHLQHRFSRDMFCTLFSMVYRFGIPPRPRLFLCPEFEPCQSIRCGPVSRIRAPLRLGLQPFVPNYQISWLTDELPEFPHSRLPLLATLLIHPAEDYVLSLSFLFFH